MILIKDVLDDIRLRCPNSYDDSAILRWINTSVDEVWEYIALDGVCKIDTSEGVATYTMPDDMEYLSIYGVVVDNKQYSGRDISDVLVPFTYAKHAEGVITIYPVPNKDGEMYIYYKKRPKKVNDNDDMLEVRDEFLELIKSSVFCIIAKANGETDLANNYSSDYNSALNEAKGKYKRYSGAYPLVKDVTTRGR
ncbi:MAG: hypothetical protein LBM38_06545 [Clostridiales bacterium]|jgi:hypothetical protein|nr:hypothetical protein [Clostridiales bacterium]